MGTLNAAIEFQIEPDAKPCPFCGGTDIRTYRYEHAAGTRYAIMCVGCVATIDPGWVRHPNVAVDMWNKRSGGAE